MSVCQRFFIKFVLKIESNHDLQTVWLNVFMYFNCFGFISLLHVISFLLVFQSSRRLRAFQSKDGIYDVKKPQNK